MTLPDPETVVARAREAPADGDVNVAVAGPVDAERVDRTADGYVGETAGTIGRLAAGLASGGAVHYPDPDFTADGPWLVLAPLSGVVATVSVGTGRATVTLDYDASDDPTLERLRARISDLLAAAQPSHDHYPVETDEHGVFTTGMTTFALNSLSVDGDLTVTFDVSTTPATSPDVIEARFADLAGVESLEYESVVGVERATPSSELRAAVETAHRKVRGDCEYAWLPDPGIFAEIPGAEKMALGTGAPGSREFSREQYQTCLDLLESALSYMEVSA